MTQIEQPVPNAADKIAGSLGFILNDAECVLPDYVRESAQKFLNEYRATRTPSPASPSPVGEGQPVAWRYRRKNPYSGKEGVWVFLDSQPDPQHTDQYDEVEPLYLAAQAPKPASGGGEPKAFYMRDNHTFRKLPLDVDAAMAAIREEFDAGYTCGMLCTKDDRMNLRHVHANGKEDWARFELAARDWVEEFCEIAAEADTAKVKS